jgi:hypothetical protein
VAAAGCRHGVRRREDAGPKRLWADAIEVCLDIAGDRAAKLGHDDFRFALHRILDSSVVYREATVAGSLRATIPTGGSGRPTRVEAGRPRQRAMEADGQWCCVSIPPGWPARLVGGRRSPSWFTTTIERLVSLAEPAGAGAAAPIEDSPASWIPIGPAR